MNTLNSILSKNLSRPLLAFALCSTTFCTFLNAQDLAAQKAKHTTKLVKQEVEKETLPEPPAQIFKLVKYPAKSGDLAAYISRPKDEKKKHPAIIWITGGFPSGGGSDYLWNRLDIPNDQSARQYRNAGMVMMYPTFRGANGNPGFQEGFYGEVDDVIRAYDYLSKLSYIDPKRIYLGGHSTGATLALLTAASTDKFRGIIAIGGNSDPQNYGEERVHYDPKDELERKLRAPIHYLNGIKSPTLITEGEGGNIGSQEDMRDAQKNPKLTFITVSEADHFNVLYPLNKHLAASLMKDPDALEKLDSQKLQHLYINHRTYQQEATDLRTLAYYRSEGIDLTKTHKVQHYFYSFNKEHVERFVKHAQEQKLNISSITDNKNDRGNTYWTFTINYNLPLNDMENVFKLTANIHATIKKSNAPKLYHDGWEVIR